MTVRVLADFHHHALWESLRILFEDRFGWDLYRPYGMAWYEQNFWQFEKAMHGDAVAKQYLLPYDDDVDRGEYTERWDRKYPGRSFRMVSLEQFRSQKWGFVVCTLDHNEVGFWSLANEVGARYGIEIGNQWGNHQFHLRPFVLSSILPNPAPAYCPSAIVRQEFDLEMFRPTVPGPLESVSTFVNCFPTAPTYPRFLATADLLPYLDWKVYGAYCEAADDRYKMGDIEKVPDIADAMRRSSIGWHDKHWSDGYGHVIHNWFAVGRPVFGSQSYYDGRDGSGRRIAADLFTPGNSVDISDLSPSEVAREIRSLLEDPDRYLRMAEAAAARFREIVDFSADAEAAYAMLTA